MKRFKIVTLGCRTNQYESQAFSDQLRQLGYEPAKEGETAELCIVNTCTVTHQADATTRHQIRHLARENPDARIAVTGCMVESAPGELQALDGRIELVSNRQKEQLVEVLFPDEEKWPEFRITQFDAHTRAFVKVQDGCNSFCTYCIIPYVRGRSRCKAQSEVLKEIRGLVANGYREVVLTGINIGDYQDEKIRLADLVRSVDQIEGIERIRISSIDPDEVDDDLANAVLESSHTCPSLHLVLQSGSNVILKRMNRKYTRQMFLDAVEKMKERCPDFTVTTDIIVGFPGESERDFLDTLEIVQQVNFAKIHLFPYSKRDRTRAALYPNQISPQVMDARKQILLREAEKTAFFLRQQFVGREMSVLLEGSEGEFFTGHTENFLRVNIPRSEGLEANQIVQVKLLANDPAGLIGSLL